MFTDELVAYWVLNEKYVHQINNHAEQYVDGDIHTNGLENFWSLLKRGLSGTYVSVEPLHLFRYLDEQIFRYNLRKLPDGERFIKGLQQIVGKRLTYDELTGKLRSLSPESCPTVSRLAVGVREHSRRALNACLLLWLSWLMVGAHQLIHLMLGNRNQFTYCFFEVLEVRAAFEGL